MTPRKIKAKDLHFGLYLLRLRGRVLETAPSVHGEIAIRYGSNDTYSGPAWSQRIYLGPDNYIWIADEATP